MALLANVASGDPIAPAWGNSIRDQTVQVCTSVTRPGTPAEGMLCYETDLDRVMVYTGAAWVRLYPAGIVTRTAGNAVTTSGTAESTIASVVIASQGSPYRIRVKAIVFHSQTVAGDLFAVSIKDSSTIVATARGGGIVETLQIEDVILVAGGGAKTINVVLYRAGGTGTGSTFSDATANFVTTTIEPL